MAYPQQYQTHSQYNQFEQNQNSFQSPLQNTNNQQNFGQVAYPQQYQTHSQYNQFEKNQNSFQSPLQNTYNQQNFGQVAYPEMAVTEVTDEPEEVYEAIDYEELGK